MTERTQGLTHLTSEQLEPVTKVQAAEYLTLYITELWSLRGGHSKMERVTTTLDLSSCSLLHLTVDTSNAGYP